MKYILDTNILIMRIKSASFASFFEQNYIKKEIFLGISIVSLGELESLSLQNQWGEKRQNMLHDMIESLVKIDINRKPIIDAYGQIDAYSQGRLASKLLPDGMSARNMGKNDLWIAASAYATKATLLTTDKDFSHLKDTFLSIDFIDIQSFK